MRILPNKTLETNCRPACPLDARQKFERAVHAQAGFSGGSRSALRSAKMRRIAIFYLALSVFVVAGCVTKDFKVVDALHLGMSHDEAKSVIHAYGFEMAESLDRPADGWSKEKKSFVDSSWRAGREEVRAGRRVARVEFYPVGYGLLGAGQLFLFYGDDGRLMKFYRYQIN